ncbi:MAG: TIGR04086 family membrane protein [Oscillospiraceae bacterium]
MQETSQRRAAHSSKSEQGSEKYAIVMLKAVTIGLLVTMAMLLLFSFMLDRKEIPFSLISPMSVFSLMAGAMAAGFMAARELRVRGMLLGALCGFLIFVVLLLASCLSAFDMGPQAITKMSISVISGAIGGILGVNFRHKRK